MRAASARALAHGMPDDRRVLPSVTPRALLAWLLGSGVPLVGLCAVAIVDLAGEDLGRHELAITALALGGVAIVVGLTITRRAAWASPTRSVPFATRCATSSPGISRRRCPCATAATSGSCRPAPTA